MNRSTAQTYHPTRNVIFASLPFGAASDQFAVADLVKLDMVPPPRRAAGPPFGEDSANQGLAFF